MKFDLQFINQLTAALQKPLPGDIAQYRMSPTYRQRLSAEQIADKSPKTGAVLLLLYEKAELLTIVFTQRKKYEGVHSAQMSFPGGKKESGDENIFQTAFRETEEEIGVAPEKIKVLGRLTELYIPPSNFLIYPVVGFAESLEPFRPQQKEVEKIVEIPLAFFLDKKNINLQTEIKLYNGNTVYAPAYIYNEYVIWGATAIIVSEFTYIIERL